MDPSLLKVKQEFSRVKDNRIKQGKTQKSLYEEALSSYFEENFRLAFVGAYVYALVPIAINAKRLHKKKNKSKVPFEFKMSDCLNDCLFLSKETKNELSKEYLITFENERERRVNWSLTRMRNVLLHTEDSWNFLATHHIDYQKYSLKMLYLAHKVHEEYKAYHKKTGKPNRKKKERKTYKKFKEFMSAA